MSSTDEHATLTKSCHSWDRQPLNIQLRFCLDLCSIRIHMYTSLQSSQVAIYNSQSLLHIYTQPSWHARLQCVSLEAAFARCHALHMPTVKVRASAGADSAGARCPLLMLHSAPRCAPTPSQRHLCHDMVLRQAAHPPSPGPQQCSAAPESAQAPARSAWLAPLCLRLSAGRASQPPSSVPWQASPQWGHMQNPSAAQEGAYSVALD